MEVTDEVTLSREQWSRGRDQTSAGARLESHVSPMSWGTGPAFCAPWSVSRWPLSSPGPGCDLPGKQLPLAQGEFLQNGVDLSP